MYRNLPQVRYKIELEPKKNGKRKKKIHPLVINKYSDISLSFYRVLIAAYKV